MSKIYDVIVVGAGSMGMSAGYELARRGLRTLLIDAFDPPHSNGSHHGETRLIRHAYHGGPAYVRMALRADERWLELEDLTGEKLLERSGVLNMSDPDFYSYEGRLADSHALGVTTELLEASEIAYRWPGIRLPESYKGMYEPNAGYLYSERCVSAYRKAALDAGAVLLTNSIVTGLKTEGSIVTVSTPNDVYTAGHVILSAGAWFKTLEPFVRLPIRAVRSVVGWFGTDGPSFDAGTFPGFTFGGREGGYYGFPSIGGAGLKIGGPDAGVEWKPGEAIAPFGAYPEDEGDLRTTLQSIMPGAAGKLLRSAVCKSEYTPDENFIIDFHPAHPNVLLAGGFSGHGFKFSSVVGEVLADLIEHQRTDQDIRMFSARRFSEATVD